MKLMAGVLALAALGVIVWLAVRQGSNGASIQPTARTPVPAPPVEPTAAEERMWAPLPADRSAIPTVLYQGIGAESDFESPEDAALGIGIIPVERDTSSDDLYDMLLSDQQYGR